jgi:copper oxidase (laccase) domain-containing protein
MVRNSQNLVRRERDGVAWYEAGGPAPGSDVLAAFSTRQGGVSDDGLASLNLSYRVSDDPARVAENHRRLFRALGLAGRPVVAAGQVHGRRVAVVDDSIDEPVVPGVDGLVTARSDVVLTLLFADCVPRQPAWAAPMACRRAS